MCGIVGYIGRENATPIIMEGLRKLEYRGYDSAGISTIHQGEIAIRRSRGKLANLEKVLSESPLCGSTGIGHTRWATHGRPSEINAHPHKAGSVVVVHNGIVENYVELREELKRDGRIFMSETDTEVISHLIDREVQKNEGFQQAVRNALAQVRGAYALCILCEREPGMMIAAKAGSPMVIGLGEGEFFVASDIPAILSHTREMVFMEDNEMVVFHDSSATFSTLAGEKVEKTSRHIDWSPLMAEKGDFKHFMLKEIFEQPRAILDTIAGRMKEAEGDVYLEDLSFTNKQISDIERITIIACGTSWHAALVGKFLIEEHCRIPVEVDYASEFRYRNPVVTRNNLVILISQSGETADTLAAMREAKRRGAKTLAICNVIEASIPREADAIIYTHAGPEIGVASTKAFITQLVALYLLTIRLGRSRGEITLEQGQKMVAAMLHLPQVIEKTLALNDQIEKAAKKFVAAKDFLYLGRGINYPIALEGALKLKEISYIHAEGYAAGEMKHGPIALIDENVPVVVLAPDGKVLEKVLSNMEEVIARGGRVIAVCNEGSKIAADKVEVAFEVPEVPEGIMPIVLSIPMQLLAYHIAVLKGTDVDQPKSLAKSVTVE